MPTTGERFERAVSIMSRLRGPGGCPWDREQTFDSIKPYTIEETYEVLEAIDNRDWEELPGELGDLLLQVLFYAEMANEQSSFSIDDVLDRLSTKLINRHPHVFGDVKAETSADVKRNWEAIKACAFGMIIHASMYASQGAFIISQFAPKLRYTGSSIAYTFGSLAGGAAFAPLIMTAIFKQTGHTLLISAYILAALAGSGVAVAFARGGSRPG